MSRFNSPYNKELNDKIGVLSESVKPMRKRLVTFTAGTTATWNSSTNNLLFRLPMVIPKKGKRFRVRLHNFNQSAGEVGVGAPITLTGVAIGKAALDGSNVPNGNFSDTPVQVIDSTVMPLDGSAWYSDWIDVGMLNVSAGDLALLSFGVKTSFTNGMKWARSILPVMYKSGTADTEVAAKNITLFGTSPVCTDFSIQWETHEGQPSTLFVGDSITEGSAGSYQSFPNIFGQLTNSAVASTAQSGGTAQLLASYHRNDPLWEKVGLLTHTPDTAFLFIGSNDLNSGLPASEIYGYIKNLFDILKGAGIERIFGATVPPRGFVGGVLNSSIAAGATSFTSSYNPVNGQLQLGSTSDTAETVSVTSVTGTASPFTINITPTTKPHTAGELFARVNSFEYNRINLNILLRENSLGFVRVFDFDNLLKDTTNGTLFDPARTSDGIHPKDGATYGQIATLIKGIAIP